MKCRPAIRLRHPIARPQKGAINTCLHSPRAAARSRTLLAACHGNESIQLSEVSAFTCSRHALQLPLHLNQRHAHRQGLPAGVRRRGGDQPTGHGCVWEGSQPGCKHGGVHRHWLAAGQANGVLVDGSSACTDTSASQVAGISLMEQGLQQPQPTCPGRRARCRR